MKFWNEAHGDVTMRWISDNLTRSGIVYDGLNFSFTFNYMDLEHRVHISQEEVMNKFEGDLSEAIIYHEYREFAKFKQMMKERLNPRQDDKQIAEDNRINRTMKN